MLSSKVNRAFMHGTREADKILRWSTRTRNLDHFEPYLGHYVVRTVQKHIMLNLRAVVFFKATQIAPLRLLLSIFQSPSISLSLKFLPFRLLRS